MSKKYHASMSDEYMFLKNKVVKILGKSFQEPVLTANREKRRARKFIRRMKEIEKIHNDMGWPHPEAKFKPHPNLKEALETLKQQPGKDILANPDGTLFEKDSSIIHPGTGFTISTKGVMNPDGTPFETPVMPGSVIGGGGPGSPHSEEKVKKYLEGQDDGFLRTDD